MWWLLLVIHLLVVGLDITYRTVYNYRARSRECATCANIRWYDLILPFGLYRTLDAIIIYSRGNVLEFSLQSFVKAGRLTIINWFSGTWGVMTCNPEVIKAALSTSFKDFGLGKRHAMFHPLLGNGIFTASGEAWKHSRAMLRPQFARDQISHLESIKLHADLFIDRVLEESKTATPDAQELFFSLTFDTAVEFLCGESAGTLTNSTASSQPPIGSVTGVEFVKAFSAAQKVLGYRAIVGSQFFRAVDGPSFRRNLEVCNRYIDPYVRKALEKPMEKDEVAQRYAFVRELTKVTRDPQVIHDQAFSIMMAARDTTAGTMSFLTCHLAKRPDIWARLKKEVFEHFGTEAATISFESLKRCKYLSNVINETLRLNPIVPFNIRYATRDTVIPTGGGPYEDQPLFIPKGGIVLFSTYSMHRHEKFWGADAGTFNPDRWEDTRAHANQWDFLPFSGGPRICLGQQFALIEIACVFVRICQRVNDIETFFEGDPAQIKQHLGITASVRGGVPSRWT